MRGVKKTLALLLVASCAAPSASPPAKPASPANGYPYNGAYPPPSQGQYAPPYPQQPYSPQPYTPQPYAPQPAPAPQAPSRPLLPPLVGTLAWRAEVQSVIAEDIAALAPENQARVRGIPLVFDPTLDINAYASCDAQGNPAVTGTEGLLEMIDAIAQTKACDELYGARTYDAYAAQVLPQLVAPGNASPMLPPTIPPQCVADPRRWSRAHEWFDEMVAFTFGHELSHHYLGTPAARTGRPRRSRSSRRRWARLVTASRSRSRTSRT